MIDALNHSGTPMMIRDVVVAMYHAAGHRPEYTGRYEVERLGRTGEYRKLVLSMIRSGALVRSGYGSHYVTTPAILQELKNRTPYTVVAFKTEGGDEWMVAACLRNVVVTDAQWALLPEEDNWSRYCDTFYAPGPDEAVEAALAHWTRDDEDDEKG
ncbi:hypothetical protein [Streptomyces sp. NPDC001889]